LSDEGEAFPDLLMIDGGKGQLNAVMETFQLLDITPPRTVSLAKREEEIYLPGESEPIRLSRHAWALRLLQYVRDEAHRFAQHYHHMLRRRSSLGDSAGNPKRTGRSGGKGRPRGSGQKPSADDK
jgi:excinuclease ABC subunit C